MTDTRQALTNLLARQEAERRDLAERLLAEEQAAATALVNAVTPESGRALSAALDAVEQQLRAARRDGSLRVRIATDLPPFLDTNFPMLDRDQRAAGVRDVIVVIPRGFADGHTEPLALALIDISDLVHGPGSRARRDQQQEAEAVRVEQLQEARRLEDERERARR